ncbi:Arc family DNA-binding protein [Pseudomonas brenneri]|uniref:Arc family DNA-binding protein n=1 Tax=Pseudomonas brenneri TaxID=129817 RepID=UPI003B9F1F84
MQKKTKRSPFPLRLADAVKERAKNEAAHNRRSLNSEFGLLIEEGFRWREMQNKQAAV